MTETNRRAFLRRAAAAGGVSVAGTGIVSAAPGGGNGGGPAGLRGRVQRANNKPAGRDLLNPGAQFDYVQTNRGGVFTVDGAEPGRVPLGYYQTKPGFSRIPAPVRDGSPDVFSFGQFEVTEGPTNLGTLSLPEAFLVDVIVEDTDGNPVEGAQFRVASISEGATFGTGSQQTNAEGRLQYADADFAGTELAGEVEIQVAPEDADRVPADDPRVKRRRLFVTEPRTERFVLDV